MSDIDKLNRPFSLTKAVSERVHIKELSKLDYLLLNELISKQQHDCANDLLVQMIHHFTREILFIVL